MKNFTLSNGLVSNEIFNLYEDRGGRIWQFNFNGEPSYFLNGKFHTRSNDTLLKKLPVLSYINAMYEEGDQLFIGYVNGQVIKVEDGSVIWINKKENPYRKFLTFAKFGNSLFSINIKSWERIRGEEYAPDWEGSYKFAYFNEQQLIIATHQGVVVYEQDKSRRVYKDLELTAANIIRFYSDSSNLIFCGTRQGLWIINQQSGSISRLLDNVIVTGISRNPDGGYWITTLGQGVFYLNTDLRTLGPSTGLPSQLRPLNNKLLLRNRRTYYEINDSSKKLSLAKVRVLNEAVYRPFYLSEKQFIYMDVLSVDRSYNLYIHDRQLDKVFIHDFAFDVQSMYHIDGDTFLVISGRSIILARINNLNALIVAKEVTDKISVSYFDSSARCLYYISGRKLCSYSIDSRQIGIIDNFSSIDYITSISRFGSMLILCTNANKIFAYSALKQQKNIIHTGDIVIHSISVLDSSTNLVNTQNGFYLLTYQPNDIINYSLTKIEYPLSNFATENVYAVGKWIVCESNGKIFYFENELLQRHVCPPRLYLEKIQANAKECSTNHVRLDNTVEAALKITLSAVSAEKNLNFLYRIHRNEWSSWYYTHSPNIDVLIKGSGTYYIEIRAVNSNQVQSRSIYLALRINPPFFRSNLFYCLVTVAFFMLLCFLFVYYSIRKRKAYQRNLQYLQLEHKAISALLNPHFIFNVINNIQNLVNTGSKENASKYLGVMSKLIRQNMENLQVPLIPLTEELNLILNYVNLQNLRFEETIFLKIENAALKPEHIFLPPLLIQPFVENAIIHGLIPGTNLNLNISISSIDGDYLQITVSDDGRGYEKSSNPGTDKTSLGIEFNKTRLQRLSEFYKLKSGIEVAVRNDNKGGTFVKIIVYSKLAELYKSN